MTQDSRTSSDEAEVSYPSRREFVTAMGAAGVAPFAIDHSPTHGEAPVQESPSSSEQIFCVDVVAAEQQCWFQLEAAGFRRHGRALRDDIVAESKDATLSLILPPQAQIGEARTESDLDALLKLPPWRFLTHQSRANWSRLQVHVCKGTRLKGSLYHWLKLLCAAQGSQGINLEIPARLRVAPTATTPGEVARFRLRVPPLAMPWVSGQFSRERWAANLLVGPSSGTLVSVGRPVRPTGAAPGTQLANARLLVSSKADGAPLYGAVDFDSLRGQSEDQKTPRSTAPLDNDDLTGITRNSQQLRPFVRRMCISSLGASAKIDAFWPRLAHAARSAIAECTSKSLQTWRHELVDAHDTDVLTEYRAYLFPIPFRAVYCKPRRMDLAGDERSSGAYLHRTSFVRFVETTLSWEDVPQVNRQMCFTEATLEGTKTHDTTVPLQFSKTTCGDWLPPLAGLADEPYVGRMLPFSGAATDLQFAVTFTDHAGQRHRVSLPFLVIREDEAEQLTEDVYQQIGKAWRTLAGSVPDLGGATVSCAAYDEMLSALGNAPSIHEPAGSLGHAGQAEVATHHVLLGGRQALGLHMGRPFAPSLEALEGAPPTAAVLTGRDYSTTLLKYAELYSSRADQLCDEICLRTLTDAEIAEQLSGVAVQWRNTPSRYLTVPDLLANDSGTALGSLGRTGTILTRSLGVVTANLSAVNGSLQGMIKPGLSLAAALGKTRAKVLEDASVKWLMLREWVRRAGQQSERFRAECERVSEEIEGLRNQLVAQGVSEDVGLDDLKTAAKDKVEAALGKALTSCQLRDPRALVAIRNLDEAQSLAQTVEPEVREIRACHASVRAFVAAMNGPILGKVPVPSGLAALAQDYQQHLLLYQVADSARELNERLNSAAEHFSVLEAEVEARWAQLTSAATDYLHGVGEEWEDQRTAIVTRGRTLIDNVLPSHPTLPNLPTLPEAKLFGLVPIKQLLQSVGDASQGIDIRDVGQSLAEGERALLHVRESVRQVVGGECVAVERTIRGSRGTKATDLNCTIVKVKASAEAVDISVRACIPLPGSKLPFASNVTATLSTVSVVLDDIVTIGFKRLTVVQDGAAVSVRTEAPQVEFQGLLQLLKALKELIGGGDDAPFAIDGTDIRLSLVADVPSLSLGAFSITNLRPQVSVRLPLKGPGCPLLQLAVSDPAKPCVLSVGIFGGTFWVAASLPFGAAEKQGLGIDGAIAFGGAFAFSVGPLAGGLYLVAGVEIHINPATEARRFCGFVRLSGYVEVLSIASVSLDLMVEVCYDPGRQNLYGFADISLSVRLGFFRLSFTKRQEVVFGSRSAPPSIVGGPLLANPASSDAPLLFSDAVTEDEWNKDYLSRFLTLPAA